MKRFFAFIFALAMLLSVLSGCGAQAPVPSTEPVVEETLPPETKAPEEEVTVRLGALTGPTAMGMVKIFKDADNGEVNYEFTLAGSADELTPLFLQGELDIISVPANLGSVLYNKTEGGVKALAVNVLGVLYIGEFNSEEIQTVADLKGKTVYATGKGSTPEYFLRYLLAQNGLDPDQDVNIEWKSEPNEVVALLNAEQSGIAMLPQPFATAAGAKLGEGFRLALSLSDEWAALDNGSMCTTASVLVRKAFAEEHPELVDAFIQDFAVSASWTVENVEEAAALCGEYEIIAAPVAQKAIPKCNIVCITGAEMKEALSGCLGVLFEQNPAAVGGKMPLDDYYYGA